MHRSKSYVKKLNYVMRDESDRARRWKDMAMTAFVAASLPCVAYSQKSFVDAHETHKTLTRISLIGLIAGLYTVRVTYTHNMCTFRAFLTSTSCVPVMSLYGQSDQYSTCFIGALLQTFPPSLLPLQTQSRALGAPAHLLQLNFPSHCGSSSLMLSSQPAW